LRNKGNRAEFQRIRLQIFLQMLKAQVVWKEVDCGWKRAKKLKIEKLLRGFECVMLSGKSGWNTHLTYGVSRDLELRIKFLSWERLGLIRSSLNASAWRKSIPPFIASLVLKWNNVEKTLEIALLILYQNHAKLLLRMLVDFQMTFYGLVCA